MEKPKFTIGAYAIIPNEKGEVLMGRRADNKLWDLPGGVMEAGEAPWEAVVRESREESGLVVEIVRLAGIYNKPLKSDIVFLFECRKTGGELKLSSETTDLKYFSGENLPKDITNRQIERITDWAKKTKEVSLRNQV